MEYQSNFFQLIEESDKMDATLNRVTSSEVDYCPVCGEELARSGRCKLCYQCGWSSCDL